MDKKEKKLLQQVPLKVLLVAAFFLLALFLFAYIAHEAVYEQEDAFDTRIHTYLRAHATPALIDTAQYFTFLGSSLFLLPAYTALAIVLILRKQKRRAIDVSVIGLSSFLLMQALKQVFQRKRPDLPIIKGITTYSFPSGHSLSSFIFCSILAYLIWKGNLSTIWKCTLIALLLFLCISIGASRIILNVHYATDVIAGFCLGVMWVILSFWIMQKINRQRLLQQ